MDNSTFPNVDVVKSTRIIYTPSSFARSSLIYLQETGRLKALCPHKNERSELTSYLFFTALSGKGCLVYDGVSYELKTGDCVLLIAGNHIAMRQAMWAEHIKQIKSLGHMAVDRSTPLNPS